MRLLTGVCTRAATRLVIGKRSADSSNIKAHCAGLHVCPTDAPPRQRLHDPDPTLMDGKSVWRGLVPARVYGGAARSRCRHNLASATSELKERALARLTQRYQCMLSVIGPSYALNRLFTRV